MRIFLILIFTLVPQLTFAQPFVNGEKITYELRISGIPSGTMETIFLGSDTYNGIPCYKWYSNSVYRNVEDREIFYASREEFLPLLVERYIKKRKKEKIIYEFYNQDKKILNIRENNGKEEILTYKTSIHNMILLPYYLRTKKFNVGDALDINLPRVSFLLKAIKRETINTPAGEFEAIMFKSSPKYTRIWMSVDEPVIPLRIDVKYFFFKMTMLLKKVE